MPSQTSWIVIKGDLLDERTTFARIGFRQVTYNNLLGVLDKLFRTSIRQG